MTRAGRRYKDVLLALYTAGIYEQTLTKLQLQKFIYITDTLSILWELYRPSNGYETYKFGPYDPAIQNAVDVLAFRGAVDVARVSFRGKNNIAVSYSISNTGREIVLHMENEQHVFARDLGLYKLVGQHVAKRGWENLVKFVYSEANYIFARSQGFGVSIDTNSLLSNESLQIIMGFNDLIQSESATLTRESLVSIFFQVLDNYQLFPGPGTA